MLTPEEIRTKLKLLDIPRSTVAKLCGLHLPDVSAWLNNRAKMSETKALRVSGLVERLERAISLYRIRFDLRDPKNVETLLAAVEEAQCQIGNDDLEALRARTAELVASFSSPSELAPFKGA